MENTNTIYWIQRFQVITYKNNNWEVTMAEFSINLNSVAKNIKQENDVADVISSVAKELGQ